MTRVLIAGAGALGSVYGAAFARGGAEVQLLARREHAEAVQRAGGIVVDGPHGRWEARLGAEWRPERIEAADVLVLLTKAHDSGAALAGLERLREDVEVALSLQNGVAKDSELAGWCGADRVLGAVSMVGATLEQPGRVRHTLEGTTYLGELDGRTGERPRELATLLEAGGMPVVVTDRIRSAEWSKLVHAAATMTITGLPRLPFHEALQDPGLSGLYVDSVREGAAVAELAGAELDDWPGMFPVRTIASGPRDDAVALVRERGRGMAEARSTQVRVSMLRDIDQGRRLELDAVHGFLVAEGRRHGQALPLTEAALRLLSALGPATVTDPEGSP